MNMLAAALDDFHPPMPPGKEHLVYRDFPKVQEKLWEFFLEVLKPFELEVLTYARYVRSDGSVLARGQVFVHPDGLKELLRRVKEMPEEEMNKLLK